MKKAFALLKIIFFTTFTLTAFGGTNPAKIYIVANSADNDSLAIAEFYAAAREIPKANIIAIDMPKDGKITKTQYFAKIENPLTAELVSRGAAKAFKLGAKDAYGREIYSYISHDIDFLVLCKGVPWGVNPSPKISAPKAKNSLTDAASVDSELSGRFVSAKTLNGFQKNPLFNNYSWSMTPSISGVIPVARLDGATKEDVENAIKGAIETEKKGLMGRVYIDKSRRAKEGDDWLENAKKILAAADFDISESPSPALFGYGERMDAPAFYFGWYAFRPSGYFAENGFELPRGASALHIYSFSAANLRNKSDWTARFVNIGAAATFGNVYEPYLGGTHYPHIYALALARGMSAGEAATAAMPFVSWQGMFVGDPLFKPFKVGLSEQIKQIDAGQSDELSQYAVVRKANKIGREKGAQAAFDFASKYVGKFADAALLWKLSNLSVELKRDADAIRFAEKALSRDIYKLPSNWGLAFEICDYLIPQSAKSRRVAKETLERLNGLSDSEGLKRALAQKALKIGKYEKMGDTLAKIVSQVKKLDAEAVRKRSEKATSKK